MRRLLLPMALLAALAGALAVVASAQAQGLPDPLGLRGFNLGMTLDEIRRQQYPEPTTDEVRLICTGDRRSDEIDVDHRPDSVLRKIGVKICRFHAVVADKLHEISMNVGGHDARVSFFFTPKSDDPAISERLYFIPVRADPAHFDALRAAYVARFGQPDERIGVPPTLLSWKSNHAQLMLLYRPPNHLLISYTDRVLERMIEALKARKSTPGADKL